MSPLAKEECSCQVQYSMPPLLTRAGPISSLKSLKLARLGRIIRLLKFKIFQELKLMIQGVFTGLRVLFWAVVLLIISMYLLGVITKTIFADFHEEFSTVPAAMFTWFRCFTDGCSAYDGTPLQEKVRKAWFVSFLHCGVVESLPPNALAFAHVAGVWRHIHAGLHPAVPFCYDWDFQFDYGALTAL